MLFLSLILLGGWAGKKEPAALFPVYERGYYGFVDQRGKMQIKPRFERAGFFRDGLAPVQEHHRFGYIDTRGDYVIEPRFDEAGPFEGDYAEVQMHGRKYLIDKRGKILFEHRYRDWQWADAERTTLIVTAGNGRQGVTDLLGRLIIDTLYHRIQPFSEGLTTATRYDLSAPEAEQLQAGLFNRSGDLVVPFGQFEQIAPFKNGYARVVARRGKASQQRRLPGVINRAGEVQFLLKDKLVDLLDGERMYQEGLAEIAIYTVDRDTVAPEQQSELYAYRGVIDPEGKIIFSHPRVRDITPFSQGRAFAKTSDHDWVLIDRRGQRIGRDHYQSVPMDGFADGTAVVRTENGLSLIDTEGQALLPPAEISTTYYQRRGDIVFYEVELLEKDTYIRRWGFWDLKTGEVHTPRYHKVDTETGFRDGLVQVEEDGRQGYVRRNGKYAWRARKADSR